MSDIQANSNCDKLFESRYLELSNLKWFHHATIEKV